MDHVTLTVDRKVLQLVREPDSTAKLILTAFYLDGGLNEDAYTDVANVFPNPDAVQEFTVETNSYDAKFDGKDSPYKGDPGVTSVSLKKIDANTIEETDKRNGKVISVTRMTVSADGKTMKVETQDKLRGTSAKFEGKKQ